MMLQEWIDADRLLAHSVFGTDDSTIVRCMILDWTAKQGFGRAYVNAIEFSAEAAVTIILPDQGSKLDQLNRPGRSTESTLKLHLMRPEHRES